MLAELIEAHARDEQDSPGGDYEGIDRNCKRRGVGGVVARPDTQRQRETRKWQTQIQNQITKSATWSKSSDPSSTCSFEEGHLPLIHNAVRITSEGFDVPEPIDLIAEVEQHLGEGRVRTVAMKAERRPRARHEGRRPGEPISVPVGRATLGRVMNVLGEPVDKLGPVKTEKRYPIHRPAPSSRISRRTLEMFETGIKVVDLIEPYLQGRKDRPVRRRGRRQDGSDSGAD